VTTVGGESVHAFIPHSLPPEPPIVLHGPIQPLLERALLSLGRLDSVSTLLPDPSLFVYAYVRKEAVLTPNSREPNHPFPTCCFLSSSKHPVLLSTMLRKYQTMSRPWNMALVVCGAGFPSAQG
jgi:hypothetical protein